MPIFNLFHFIIYMIYLFSKYIYIVAYTLV